MYQENEKWAWRVEDDHQKVLKHSEILYEQLNVAKAFAKIENPGLLLLVMK